MAVLLAEAHERLGKVDSKRRRAGYYKGEKAYQNIVETKVIGFDNVMHGRRQYTRW